MSYERRICVRGVIYKDGRILAQQLKDYHDTGRAAFWCTPGGGVEDGESIHEALEREMIEETGVTPEIGHLLFVQQFAEDGREQLEFFFHITNADDYAEINLANTSHGDIEIAACDFIDPATEHLLPAFLTTVDIKRHIDDNEPVYVYSELSGVAT